VGNLWKNLPAEEKRIWEEMAEKEKEEHRAYVAPCKRLSKYRSSSPQPKSGLQVPTYVSKIRGRSTPQKEGVC